MRDALDAAGQLRRAGLRATVPRLAVLTAVAQHPHSHAERVHSVLATSHPRLSIQSVHNVLRDLARHTVLRRIEPSDSPALYETRVGDNHHHLVCRGCGAVRDVPCAVGETPCLTPSDAGGYRVELAEVVFWGVCPDCSARGIQLSETLESPRIETPRRNHG